MSRVRNLDTAIDVSSWAWSSGVLHHVTVSTDIVVLARWDRTEHSVYTLASVAERLNRFYDRISQSQAATSKTITTHAVDYFRRLRSSFSEQEQFDALSVFLMILGAMVQSRDTDVFDQADVLVEEFDLSPNTPELLRRLSPEFVRHFEAGFRRPSVMSGQVIQTLPSLVVRHAGATVFQEAHFELLQRGLPDIFGVPAPASVSLKTGSGVHFTPPELARAIVEQALRAYGPLPEELTILDPACGSGSILHEALRILHDRNYAGTIKVIGYDESIYAVAMAKFVIRAFEGGLA